MLYKTDNQGKFNCKGTELIALKISFDGIFPEIYRTLILHANHTFYDLHLFIQGAFEWWNKHNFSFKVDDEVITDDLTKIYLKDFIFEAKEIQYIYDNWSHGIKLMINEELSGKISPLHSCVDGKRSRPPEDLSSIDGYNRFLDIISDSENINYDETLKWAERDTYGRKFDPEYFYKNAANRKIDFYMDFDSIGKDLLEKGLRGGVFSFNEDRIVIKTSEGQLTLNDVEHLLVKYANEANISIKVKGWED